MPTRYWLRLLLGRVRVGCIRLQPRACRFPRADRLGFTGSAAAQETIDIDTFYDELAPYGEWVWHPRFGYVWLPETSRRAWRPYTVGRWTYTDEYGWYWDSNEPFAWAVYHYGRWGYDEDYGWFWVPGDTWAPAWVQWRYSDDYVGWAPVGPGPRGYAYGVPVNYEPPIAEFLGVRAASLHDLARDLALCVADRRLGRRLLRRDPCLPADLSRRHRLQLRHAARPRGEDHQAADLCAESLQGRPLEGRQVRPGRPQQGHQDLRASLQQGRQANRGPKKFVDNPTRLQAEGEAAGTRIKGDVPKGWGKSAKGLTPIAKEDPEGFKKKGRFDGHDRDFGDRGKDKDRDKDKGQASKDFDRNDRDGKKDGGPPAPKLPPPVVKGGTGDQSKEKFGATGDRDGRDKDKDKDKSKGQASKDFDRDGKQGRKGKDGAPPPPPARPPIVKGGTGDGDIRTQTEFGTLRQHDNKDTKIRTRTSIRISAIRAAPTSSSRAEAAASGSRRPSAIKVVAAAAAVASVPKTTKAVAEVAVAATRRRTSARRIPITRPARTRRDVQRPRLRPPSQTKKAVGLSQPPFILSAGQATWISQPT